MLTEQPPHHDYIGARRVRERYDNLSDQSLWRWLNTPKVGFPQPVYFGRRRFWKLSDIEAWERTRVRPVARSRAARPEATPTASEVA